MSSSFIPCISSRLETQLIHWRISNGVSQGQNERTIKLITANIASPILAITAIIETIAYLTLALLTLPLLPFTKTPLNFCASLLNSSVFTVQWSIYFAIFNNKMGNLPNVSLSTLNYVSSEAGARDILKYVLEGIPLSPRLSTQRASPQNNLPSFRNVIPGFNPGDYLADDAPIPEFNDIPFERVPEKIKEDGADFLVNDIFAGASSKLLEQLSESHPGLFALTLTKALFLYTIGSKCNASIPEFFKEETGIEILALRVQFAPKVMENNQIIPAILAVFQDVDAYEKCLEEKSVAGAILQQLSRLAHTNELQNSVLLQVSWERALERLNIN